MLSADPEGDPRININDAAEAYQKVTIPLPRSYDTPTSRLH